MLSSTCLQIINGSETPREPKNVDPYVAGDVAQNGTRLPDSAAWPVDIFMIGTNLPYVRSVQFLNSEWGGSHDEVLHIEEYCSAM